MSETPRVTERLKRLRASIDNQELAVWRAEEDVRAAKLAYDRAVGTHRSLQGHLAELQEELALFEEAIAVQEPREP